MGLALLLRIETNSSLNPRARAIFNVVAIVGFGDSEVKSRRVISGDESNMAFGLTILRFADRYSFRMNQGVAAHEKFNSFAHFQLQGATT